MDTEPVTHIQRHSLPWRDENHLTECGLNATSFQTMTVAEAVAQFTIMGRTRFLMLTCVTCFQTADRWNNKLSAETPDLVTLIARQIRKAEYRSEHPLHAELEAIAWLIERHRDEFDEFLAAKADTVDLSAARATKAAAKRYGGLS